MNVELDRRHDVRRIEREVETDRALHGAQAVLEHREAVVRLELHDDAAVGLDDRLRGELHPPHHRQVMHDAVAHREPRETRHVEHEHDFLGAEFFPERRLERVASGRIGLRRIAEQQIVKTFFVLVDQWPDYSASDLLLTASAAAHQQHDADADRAEARPQRDVHGFLLLHRELERADLRLRRSPCVKLNCW